MAGHLSSRDYPEPRVDRKRSDGMADMINNLIVSMVQFEDVDNDVSNVNIEFDYMDILGDKGAQGHVYPPNSYNVKNSVKGTVNMANGVKAKIYQCDNTMIEEERSQRIELKNRRVVEGLHTAIISLTQLMSEGWNMKEIHMNKNGTKLIFREKKKNLFFMRARTINDILIANCTIDEIKKPIMKTLPVMVSDDVESDNEIYPNDMPGLVDTEEESDSNRDNDDDESPMAPPIAHRKLASNLKKPQHKWGHHGEERLHGMAKAKGICLVGKLQDCDACEAIKAKSTPIPKKTDEGKTAKDVGESLFVDITGPFLLLTATKWHKSIRNKMYCMYRILDQYSGKMLTSFQHTKDNVVQFVDETFKYFKGRNKTAEYLRMDTAGENLAVERLCKEISTDVEYVAADKLNNMVERGFEIR